MGKDHVVVRQVNAPWLGDKHTLALLRDNRDAKENDLTGILPVILDLDRADMPGSGIGYGGYFMTPWRMVPEAAALTPNEPTQYP